MDTFSKENHKFGRGKKKIRIIAASYHRAAGVPLGQPVPLSDLHKFESALKINISVVSSLHGNKFIYKGFGSARKRVYLYMVQGATLKTTHYHAIVNIKAFLAKSYYCDTCQVGFNDNRNRIPFVGGWIRHPALLVGRSKKC